MLTLTHTDSIFALFFNQNREIPLVRRAICTCVESATECRGSAAFANSEKFSMISHGLRPKFSQRFLRLAALLRRPLVDFAFLLRRIVQLHEQCGDVDHRVAGLFRAGRPWKLLNFCVSPPDSELLKPLLKSSSFHRDINSSVVK